ncbi:ATP-binding protein [Piscinibacter sp. XHJ-5]|uniref:sensor histidine kinase n=1 Tax=Piscinibacter sp. XHJ-5 TaxID=3037797 RepID=UPI002452A460|nr:ATP-binding protein [Piscinibacter sp. XHJ-5]
MHVPPQYSAMLIPQSVAWGMAAIIMALFAWLLSRQRRLAGELRDARIHARALGDLFDVWQWRSDADHHLTQLRPPNGTPAGAWTVPPAGELLWTRFRAGDEAAVRACVGAHSPVSDLPVQVQLPGGKLAHGQLRGIALHDGEGRFAGYHGTLRVLSATPVPPRPVPAATHADSESESFSYTVSHDLRAPIRVVEGFTKILKEDYGRLLDRIGNDHLDRVLGAAARMNCMIDALLALSQLSTQPLARQPVHLSQLAAYIADDLRRQSPERRVAVHIEPEIHVQGDPTLLRVALENLLGNAWKYTAKSRDPQIWFGRDVQQTGCVFAVRDNGAGFDMRFADRLFGVFQRLHSATEFQGTGIGLASVRRIVRRHGGDIWAESEVDRGATFRFTLGET